MPATTSAIARSPSRRAIHLIGGGDRVIELTFRTPLASTPTLFRSRCVSRGVSNRGRVSSQAQRGVRQRRRTRARARGLMRRQIEADQVPPRPLVQADADTRGVVAVRHARMASAMEGAPGTRVVGRVWDTVRGRRPRYRRAEGVAQPDTARLWGTVRPAPAWNEETVGRRRARLEASGPMPRR